MKKYLIITFCIALGHFANGQTGMNDQPGKTLTGSWYLDDGDYNSKDSLIFKKYSKNPYSYGSRIEIYENGDFVDAYSAPCGNDAQIHDNKGTWSLDPSTMIFSATIAIYQQDHQYKVITLNNDTLVLLRLTTDKPRPVK